jgi:hypothetical protein
MNCLSMIVQQVQMPSSSQWEHHISVHASDRTVRRRLSAFVRLSYRPGMLTTCAMKIKFFAWAEEHLKRTLVQ